jgi:SPW repeat-containing protein
MVIPHLRWKEDLDELDVVLGLWLFVSPWMLGASVEFSKIAVVVILGLVVAAVGLWALGKPAMRAPEWTMLALGIVVFLMPWLLNFGSEAHVAWNAWIVGVALVAFAVLTFFFKGYREAEAP